MIGNVKFPKNVSVIAILFFLLYSKILLSDDKKQPVNCLDQAVRRIMEIRSLPELKILRTLDGQSVMLDEFYVKSLSLFPKCILYTKLYYWQSKIREVVSNRGNGMIKHKTRCYNNCLSTFCPSSCDPRKTHGDVSEFYDQVGKFMGIAV